jgi:hypothetical protein
VEDSPRTATQKTLAVAFGELAADHLCSNIAPYIVEYMAHCLEHGLDD